MYDNFKVPEDIAIRLDIDGVRMSIENIFKALGSPEENAKRMADVLLYADIHGVASHGISQMNQYYILGLREGWLNPTPQWKAISEAPACATIDGDRGIGLDIGPQAMELAMDKAKACGIGAVTVTNSWHCGAIGYYATLALERDMIGMAMTSSGLYVAPTFGAKPMLGTNPIAMGAPAREETSFLFDASTSSVAMNKVALTRKNEGTVPPGWIAKSDGAPVMEQSPVPEDCMLLPVGGTREIGSHKGYGLAVMVEVLCSLLSGGVTKFADPDKFAHHFLAYNIDAFTGLESFKDQMDVFMKGLRECPPAPGHERVLHAGIPEKEAEADSRANGIPYHPEVVQWHQEIADELGIEHCFSIS
jgi:LDH2 family malate/lactate/ureidoglycolate dehydrogenase